jgi:hypothetical protein
VANLPSRKDAEALFWGVMRVALILGFGAGVLQALLLWHPTADNRIGTALAGWVQGRFGNWSEPAVAILGIGPWAAAIAFSALLLKDISRRDDLLKALAAMWRPLVLLGVAGYLLFFNDQGSELGLSLLGEHYGWPIIFMFLALIYWAANTWHTARLGLHAALERGALGTPPSQPLHLQQRNSNRHVLKGDERWLYWTPRLLGVCAHVFAAINLALAAWRLPLAAWGDSDVLRCLAGTAVLAIILATVLVWAEDSKRSIRGRAFGSPRQQKWARWLAPAAIFGEFLLLGGLAFVALYLRSLPEGFLLGTISITLSAVVFLGLISWLRNRAQPGPAATAQERAEDDRRERAEVELFTVGLFAVALIVAVAVWISPTHVGRFLGSMVVAYFAFGAILALMNAFEFAVDRAVKSQVFGRGASPRAVGAYAVAFLVALGIINAWLHPFHRVRLCDGGDCVAQPPPAGFSVAILPDDRPTVAVAAKAWYAQAKAAYEQAHHDGPVPMLIVATAGGGIRAAYWTATVLKTLENDFEKQGGVRPYLFAISGVSGGSVGAAAFEAALTRRDENHCAAAKDGDETCPPATDFLKEDFLAPALASLVFQDAPSSFLPDFGQGDRGTALERSFEHASHDLLARPFLSFFRLPKTDAASNVGQAPWWRPILLLNATHEETGNRIITGHVLIERNVFIDSLDALHELEKDVRASTAAHNSARFTYVSPAGNLGWDHGSVIDGGYFENFGALSALELAHAAKAALEDEPRPVKLVILMISSDPDLDTNHMLVRINEVKRFERAKKCLVSVAEREPPSAADPSVAQTPGRSPNYFVPDQKEVENALINEFIAPFQGLEKVREAHGNWAAAELALEVCAEFSAGEPSQKQIAATRDNSADVGVDETQPVDVKLKPDRPYFAHLAMCKDPKGNDPKGTPIQPPLGWMLSKWTEDHFDDLLKTCGNEDQLPQLETALRGKTQQDAAR